VRHVLLITAAPVLAAALVACAIAPRTAVRVLRETIGTVLVWGIFVIREIKLSRRYKRFRVRSPIRSEKRDAKRAARDYASHYAGRALSWKSAKKLLGRLEREGREVAI
jgi:hypothetical protein